MSMTLKSGGGPFDKTIKGNSNIFGIQTSNNDSKFKEFDDLDDDEDEREQSDEEPNHESPAQAMSNEATQNSQHVEEHTPIVANEDK